MVYKLELRKCLDTRPVLLSTIAMPPSDFASADIDKVLNDLTTAEAILLTAGNSEGLWYSQAVDRLGIPAIKVSQCHSS